ncbi:MAG: efflux transporter outer membrane subunit [Bacteroidetes bacterium]|nr:efflux transporter outer membrane subunit [Bacteroidota bacterium]
MNKNTRITIAFLAVSIWLLPACNLPSIVQKKENKSTPVTYQSGTTDTTNSGKLKWKEFFNDSNLLALIDTALMNNQELNIILQEINISNNEIMARKGEYLPFLHLGAGAGIDKVGRYTSRGANDANTDIKPGKEFPDPLPDFMGAATITWEVDIWKKLRNAKKSAVYRYLSTIEGKNFMVTNLVAEIAESYYELMALDNHLQIVKQNLQIQKNALEIVKLQKQAAKVTELAVKRFQAEVLKNQSMQFYIQQQIIETENRLNFLVGRFPQPVKRNSQTFPHLSTGHVQEGIPSQLLENRPDIQQAELQLMAANLDIQVAKANFYPSFSITSGLGYQAFNPKYLLQTPESMLYGLAGELVAPVVNRNAIKATYLSANAKQIQAAFNYERTILNAYIEVANQLSNIGNLAQSYDLKVQQVEALNQSINISIKLFKSARADYMEVLLTQRDALQARRELIETKMDQMHAIVRIYRALGGGWR